jgi:hypothetical protein
VQRNRRGADTWGQTTEGEGTREEGGDGSKGWVDGALGLLWLSFYFRISNPLSFYFLLLNSNPIKPQIQI